MRRVLSQLILTGEFHRRGLCGASMRLLSKQSIRFEYYCFELLRLRMA
jgi:hypothetical protein